MAHIITLLQSIYPSRDKTDVPVNTSVKLVFANAMQSASLNKDTVNLTDISGKLVSATYSYHASSRTLTISPVSELSATTAYTLFIKGGVGGVMDIMGNHSYQDYSFSFLTGEKETPEEDIKQDPSVEEPPKEQGNQAEVPQQISSLSILDSYPTSGGVLKTNQSIVVAFSFPVKKESLGGRVELKEKSFSPLLADMNPSIPVSIDLSEDGLRLIVQPSVALLEGFEYTFTLKKGILMRAPFVGELETNYKISFINTWSREYTNAKLVRLLAGSFSDGFTDGEITELISRESNALYYKIQRTPNYNQSEWADNLAPFGAEQYIRYSVVYQMALGQTLETSSGQRSDIKLGDLSVGGGTTVSSSVGDILDLLKGEIDRWWRVLKGEIEEGDAPSFIKGPGTATRAGDKYTYPEFQKRVPFSDLGG